MEVRTIVVSNRFKAIAAQLHIDAAEVVRETADKIAASERSSTSQRIARTIKVRRQGALTSTVIAGDKTKALHAGFVEYGTAHRAAKPFATPAAEAQRSTFMRRMKTIVRR